jgi:hypothetical protein
MGAPAVFLRPLTGCKIWVLDPSKSVLWELGYKLGKYRETRISISGRAEYQ